MRILQANKFFYNSGGADKVFFETISGLKKRGHEVIEFSMQSKKNLPSKYSNYFVSEIPARLGGSFGLVDSLKIAKRFFYSGEVKQKLSKLIHDTKPEVAHLHNVYHHLSAGIFTTLFKHNIPTVLTLHDYFPLCPNHNFAYKDTFNKEKYKKNLYSCIQNKCINNKLAPSIIGTFEAYFYRLKHIWKKIDYFICPSEFMKQTMIEFGFEEKRLKIINNFVSFKENIPPHGNKIVYLGRLDYEKGITFFMEAIKNISEFEVLVIGEGKEEKWVDEYIKKNKLTHVNRRKWVEGKEWEKVISEAKTMVFPSIFYENCSLGILEAMNYGRIVIASDRGGNKEIIKDVKTGFLVPPENSKILEATIKKAMTIDNAKIEQMQEATRKSIKNNFSEEEYFLRLQNLYSKL